MPHEMHVTRCKTCYKPNLTYFEFGVKKVYQKCECKQLNQNRMKTEIKITDHLKREHLVSFNFTVRTYGFNRWKIYADVRSNGERISFEYEEGKDTIDWLMEIKGANYKADFLATNLRVKEHQLIYSWLSDFPRWRVIDAISKEVLTEERTFSKAEDMAESFYFVENVKIVDTWSL